MWFNAMVLRIAFTAINPHGRIGLGMRNKERSYCGLNRHGGELHKVQEGVELTWIHFEDVDDWVVQHARRSYDDTDDSLNMALLSYLSTDVSVTDPLLKGWSWT